MIDINEIELEKGRKYCIVLVGEIGIMETISQFCRVRNNEISFENPIHIKLNNFDSIEERNHICNVEDFKNLKYEIKGKNETVYVYE